MAPRKVPLSIPSGAKVELGVCGETYVHHKGRKLIPETVRPDGSVRKALDIRPGYTPIEEQRKFRGSSGVRGNKQVGGELLSDDSDDTIPAKWKKKAKAPTSNTTWHPNYPSNVALRKDPEEPLPEGEMRTGWFSSDEEGEVSDEMYRINRQNKRNTGQLTDKDVDIEDILSEVDRKNNEKKIEELKKEEAKRLEEEAKILEEENRLREEKKKKDSLLEKAKGRLKMMRKRLDQVEAVEKRVASGVRISGPDSDLLKKKDKLRNELEELLYLVEYYENESLE